MIYLITGASGSGKSEYAEKIVCALAEREEIRQKIYFATMENVSREAKKRIARHQKMREGKGFVTQEVPFGLSVQTEPKEEPAVALLECISNLLANLMFEKHMSGENACCEILSQIERSDYRHIVIVTNEIFSDGTFYDGEMKEYQQALGTVNRKLAQRADSVCEVVYSVPVFLKGEALCPC